jgi:cytochrome c-type biogenesis protein
MKTSALTAWRTPGVLGAFGYGLVFSLGTSVAPLLLLLTIAAAQGPQHALLLAFVFGLGRGLPFLIAGLAGSALSAWTRLGAWSQAIQVASGIALLGVAVYYVDVFRQLL